ncbi:cytochrome P450 2C20-like isoform X2 [Mixophyes fleayi]|uniref:cytochrome P450 2C20-like isoform X2 n=1 Tax=Mixophyes fleayi TaxID=3061075 RepID=UPI003F4DB8E0
MCGLCRPRPEVAGAIISFVSGWVAGEVPCWESRGTWQKTGSIRPEYTSNRVVYSAQQTEGIIKEKKNTQRSKDLKTCMMETLTIYLCYCILLLLLISSWRMHKRRIHFPPGPTPLPLVGNIFQGSFVLYQSYHKFCKQYGPIFTVWQGSSPMVVLCGYKVVKDALINHSHQFGGRGPLPITERLAQGYGIVSTNSKRWEQMRRFALTTLRNFGMGKRSMEHRVLEEAQYLIKTVEETCGEAFNPQAVLACAINNVLNLVVFGRRLEYGDKRSLKVLNSITNLLNFIRAPLGVAYVTFERIMKYLPGRHQKIFEECEHIKSVIKDQINSHRSTLNPDSPRDFIDCFLIQANKVKELASDEFCQENLIASAFELYVAGTETTTNTMQFGLLVMITYPHIQDKIQKEIDTVIGPHRLPGISDRIKMPYTNAVVHELLRYADIVPMALPHMATEDIYFRGHTIPKGTTIIPLISSALSDADHWKTPDDFNPEHFLDENGMFCAQEALIPFSAGKRACPGEGLARMEIFLFLTGLLHKFTFKPANSSDPFNLKILKRDFRKQGLVYTLRAYPRAHSQG